MPVLDQPDPEQTKAALQPSLATVFCRESQRRSRRRNLHQLVDMDQGFRQPEAGPSRVTTARLTADIGSAEMLEAGRNRGRALAVNELRRIGHHWRLVEDLRQVYRPEIDASCPLVDYRFAGSCNPSCMDDRVKGLRRPHEPNGPF